MAAASTANQPNDPPVLGNRPLSGLCVTVVVVAPGGNVVELVELVDGPTSVVGGTGCDAVRVVVVASATVDVGPPLSTVVVVVLDDGVTVLGATLVVLLVVLVVLSVGMLVLVVVLMVVLVVLVVVVLVLVVVLVVGAVQTWSSSTSHA